MLILSLLLYYYFMPIIRFGPKSPIRVINLSFNSCICIIKLMLSNDRVTENVKYLLAKKMINIKGKMR